MSSSGPPPKGNAMSTGFKPPSSNAPAGTAAGPHGASPPRSSLQKQPPPPQQQQQQQPRPAAVSLSGPPNSNASPAGERSSTHTPIHRKSSVHSKKGSPAASPSHRGRPTNANGGGSGQPGQKQQQPPAAPANPAAAAAAEREGNGNTSGGGVPTHGRRAVAAANANGGGVGGAPSGDDGKGNLRNNSAQWFEPDKANRPADTELNRNVATVNDGVVDQEQAKREQEEKAQRQKERLAQHISDPPTGYHALLPRLGDLDVTNSWDKLLRMIQNEYDMSCLTSCLARELDEDVTWNPEMLLVQLTSDLLDAAELQKDNEAYVPVDASDIGQMTGGEVTRKRGEKGAPANPSGATGAAAAPPTAVPTKASMKSSPQQGGDRPGPAKGFAVPPPTSSSLQSPQQQQHAAMPSRAAGKGPAATVAVPPPALSSTGGAPHSPTKSSQLARKSSVASRTASKSGAMLDKRQSRDARKARRDRQGEEL